MQTKDELKRTLVDVYDRLLAAGVIRTKKDFAELLNVDYSNLTQAMKGNDRFLTDSLVSKAVSMMNTYQGPVSISHSNVANGNNNIQVLGGSQAPDDQSQGSSMVPVIPTNLYKENDVNILEFINDEDNVVPLSPAVQQFPKTDLFYTVQTMAMYPHLHQGDILALKAVKRETPIVNGELYAVDTIDLGILVRFTYDRGDQIELRGSEDEQRFEPFFVKKQDVYNIFRVVGLVRTNI